MRDPLSDPVSILRTSPRPEKIVEERGWTDPGLWSGAPLQRFGKGLLNHSAAIALMSAPAGLLVLGITLPSMAQAAGTQLNGTYNSTVNLANYDSGNPFTIGAGGNISAAVGNGVYGIVGTAWMLTNQGTISTAASDGVGVSLNTGTIANSDTGVITGGSGIQITGGGGSISNAGIITGTLYGIKLGAGGTIMNTSTSATIYGALFGINAINAAVTVINQGTIKGGSVGIDLQAGGSISNLGTASVISSPLAGIVIGVSSGAGAVFNQGSISSGLEFGIYMGPGGGIITNSGTASRITGRYDGIFIYGAGSVTNEGTIVSTAADHSLQAGVRLREGGSVANTGMSALISGAGQGVFIYGGAGSVTNDGTIMGSGTSGIGVAFGGNSDSTLINSGTIIGRGGIAVQFGGGSDLLELLPGSVITGAVDGGGNTNLLELAAGTLGNTGTFGSSVTNFILVRVDSGANWLISNTGTIGTGVDITLAGTLTNAGTISSTVTLTGSGSLSNSGTIVNPFGNQYYSYGVTSLSLASSVTNTGTIGGVYLQGTGTVSNLGSSATISGMNNGILIDGAGAITNEGTILGRTQSGIYLRGGGSVTNSGLIQGATDGIQAGAGATITNYGMITGTNGTGVELAGPGTLTNKSTGVISGVTGVAFVGTGGSLSNMGTINGTGVAGVSFGGAGSNALTNDGNITGVGAGVEVTGGTALITNHGTIAGTGTAGIGVLFTGGSGTIDNFGMISGAGGTAVKFAGGTNELVIESGGVLSGVADGTNGVNTLLVEGSAMLNSVQAIGFQYVGFFDATRAIDANSTITNAKVVAGTLTNQGTLNGIVTIANIATLVNSGVITDDSLTNDGVLSNSGTIANAGLLANNGIFGNAGVVTNNGTLANSGTLTNSGSIVGTLDGVTGGGVITNSGTIIGTTGTGVNLTGSGTLTNLAGALIQGGQYGIRAGAGDMVVNAGTILDDVTAGAALGSGATVTNQSSGTISGVTGVIFTGTGASLTNTGTITGTGGIAVQFDAGANSLTLDSGSVLNGGIDGGGGAGQLALQGTGTLTNTISNFGAGSALTIASAADWTASGSWTIATVRNSGTLQAGTLGNPLRLTGNFIQGSGGTLRVALDAGGGGSQFAITGTASVAGKLAIVPSGTFLAASTPYTILTATGGVTGTFGQVTGGTALLTPVVTYDPDDIVVTLNQQSVSSVVPPAGPSSAGTPNQRAVAAGLDGAIAVNASGFAAALNGLDQLSAPGVRASLDRLSGEANADLPSLALMAGEQFTGQIRKQGQLARLGDSGTDAGQSAMAAGGRQQVASLGGGPSENALANIEHPWGVWTSGYGQTGQLDGDGNAHSLNETIAGGAFGADYRLYPALRIGAALGYGRTTYSLDNVGDHGFIDHTQVGLYADYSVGRAYIDGTIGIAFGDATTRRDVSLPGTRAEARGNSSSTEILGSFEGGYALALGTATLTPFVGLSFGSVDQNGFAEIGAGALDLATHKQTLSSVKTALGARLNNDLTLAGRVFTTDLSVGWSHEFAAIDRNVLTAFSGAPATGFLIDGARVARNSAIVGLGFATAVSTKGNVYLHYDGDLAGSATSHAISAGFHYSW